MRLQAQIIVGLAALAVAAFAFNEWYNRPEQCFDRATAALKRDDTEAVGREITKIARNPHFKLHNQFLRGNLLLREGKSMEAMNELGPAMAHPLLELNTMILIGQANYQLGRPGPAAQMWNQALSQDPDAVDAHLWLGAMYVDFGAYDHAVAHFTKASELDPTNPRPDRVMGFIHKDYERFEFAVTHYLESLRRDPDQHDADDIRFELAHCQIRQHQFEEALATLAVVPDSSRVLSRRAQCYHRLGDEQQARDLNAKALGMTPVDYDAYILQGQIHMEAGEHDEAVKAFQDAVADKPRVQEAHYKLSQAFRLAGKKELADKHGAIADELKKKWDQFSDMNKEAMQEPANADLHFEIALMAEDLDRLDLAQKWLRTACSADTNHIKAAQKLREVNQRIAAELGHLEPGPGATPAVDKGGTL